MHKILPHHAILGKSAVIFMILFFLFIINGKGQNLLQYNDPITVKIASSKFDKDRNIKIYLPKDYNHTTIAYPILYVLDGQRKELEQFVMATTNYLVNYNAIPRFIVVVIPQVNRGYELNPAIPGQNIAAIGGADSFLNFLTDVNGYLKTQYRTAPFNLIFGHSLGGSLATYALIKRLELFKAYIIASPNLIFNKGYYYKTVDSLITTNPSLVRSMFIYLTADDQWQVEKNFRPATLKADSIFKKAKSDKYFFADSKGYGHNTTPPVAFIDAMSKIFAPYWQGGQDLGDQIWSKKEDPEILVKRYYKKISAYFGYTLVPSLGDYQYYIGKAYLDLKNYANAEKFASEGLTFYPNDADLLIISGDAKAGLNRKGDAVKEYNKAISASDDQEQKSEIRKKIENL